MLASVVWVSHSLRDALIHGGGGDIRTAASLSASATVIPDVKVEPTRADVAAGKYADSDPVFEKALEILRWQASK